jgi:hypothetical protein
MMPLLLDPLPQEAVSQLKIVRYPTNYFPIREIFLAKFKANNNFLGGMDIEFPFYSIALQLRHSLLRRR